MDASTFVIVMLASLAVAVAATFAFLGWRQDRRMKAANEARLQRERERIAARLAPIPGRSGSSWATERRGTARSFSTPAQSPAPTPQPDYLTQHLIWQSLNTPAPAPEPSHDSSCRASSYSSGGGGDFGGGGASSSWESSSSSDSSISSSDSSISGSSTSSE